MQAKKLFSVAAFAQAARVSVAMLHHYDKLGLLSPIKRGDNNYRYYSLGQLPEISLIKSMQDLGISLREIQYLRKHRTPEETRRTLERQLEEIDRKIADLNKTRELTKALLSPIVSVDNVDEQALSMQQLPSEPIVMGEWNEYSDDEDSYDKLADFYAYVDKMYPHIERNLPAWGMFSAENLKEKMAGRRVWPQRYYFYSPEGRDRRPAGLYAIGYIRGGYGESSGLYARMKDYISKHGYEAAGEAYEEYPLNEMCIADDSNYLMRVMIPVRTR